VRYAGGYEDYVRQRVDRRASRPASPPAEAPAPKKESKGKRKGLTHAERIELESIVDAVDAADRRVAEVEALLSDPLLYSQRGGEVAGLQARLAAAREEAARLADRWEALEAKK
jgi:ATP-binding cassette subfamily F protein uup